MYPATSILDLKSFTNDDVNAARARLQSNPESFRRDYRKVMTEIPNLHRLLRRFQSYFPGDESASMFAWFRIWAALKSDEDIGIDVTLSLLRMTRNLDESGVPFSPQSERKPLEHFFETLYKLIA
ncbi:MAG: hypothetical protein HZA81_02080 [Candidatus Taylorbacteria bacterium]|nr:hypothetical protein [Candidatus Taylorbacteria bacterium]